MDHDTWGDFHGLDCFLGDPVWFLPHPVILIGKLISFLEKNLRKLFPKTDRGEFAAGTVMALLIPFISAGTAFGILWLCFFVHPWLYFAVCAFMCWQIFAARCLQKEAAKVVRCLTDEGLEAGRKQEAREKLETVLSGNFSPLNYATRERVEELLRQC